MTAPTTPRQSGSQPAQGTPPGYHGSVADGNLAHSMELRDFLDRLGLIMRLPKKRKPKPEEAGAARSLPWKKVLIGAGAAAVIFTASQVMSGMQKTSVTVPGDFLGTWRTDNKKYATRGFRISETQIELNTGQKGLPKVRPIQSVDTRQSHDTTYLIIQYLEDNQPVEWQLAMASGSPGTLRFPHQPDIIWVKSNSAR